MNCCKIIGFLLIISACNPKPLEINSSRNNVYPIGHNGKWGLTTEDGEFILTPSLDSIRPFKYDFALAKTNGLYGFIDKNGNWVIKPKYSKASEFEYDCSEVEHKGKKFYVNRKGKKVHFKHCEESRLIPGCFPGYELENIDQYILHKDSFLAIKYRQIEDTTDFIYQSVQRFDSDFFVVKRNGKYGFFFRAIPRVYKGNVYLKDTIETYEYDDLIVPLPPKYKYDTTLHYSTIKYYKFRKGKFWGILNYQRKEIIPAKYYSIKTPEKEPLFLVEYLPNKYGYVDNRGNEKFVIK